MAYDLRPIRAARLDGVSLRLAARLLESPFAFLLLPLLLRAAGINSFRRQSWDDSPTFAPIHDTGGGHPGAAAVSPGDWPQKAGPHSPGFRFASIHDYARAYREGATSPLEVAERVLRAVDAGNHATPPMRAVIAVQSDDVLRQAKAATRRLQQGSPLSLLDGVPFGIKDEVDMVPYATTAGTAFLGRHPSTTDATVVARLRAAGALLIGKTNMHEIGIGVTGLNPVHGTPRNPYEMSHHTGGSSSGSASAVASGLCTAALAADGGGSIRIPAALCGVVGLKPTYGRVSEHGAVPLCWSVAHIGPIAANVTDAALGYAALAGPDSRDPSSLHQPSPSNKGSQPWAGSISDGTGSSFWGATPEGGEHGYGTIFKINVTSGVLTTLVEFTDNGATNKGSNPLAELVSDGSGSFWGTTNSGGRNGFGTVFKVNVTTGELTTLAEFTDEVTYPQGALVNDGSGFFWGTTHTGGMGASGTVFKIDSTSGKPSTVVEFADKGREPTAGLVSDGTGFFWGTTSKGGTSGYECGTIFKVHATTGVLTTVVRFTDVGDTNKGRYPHAELVSDGLGSFLGTTSEGGAKGRGTVFKINARTEVLSTLVEFGKSRP